MRKLRRNDIVMEKENRGFSFYGRVNRVIDNETVEVIDCGRYVTIYLMEDLICRNDYKGYWREFGPLRRKFPVFVKMTSLRKLKTRAAVYKPQVWLWWRKREEKRLRREAKNA